MSRLHTLPSVALSLLFILLVAGLYSTARSAAAQTVPTRTPTPEPGGGDSPTATPDDGDDGEPGPAPTSTDEAQPQQTATSTTGAPAVTPEGGALPTAEACATEPTLQPRAGNVNVRSGPGLDYAVVEQLQLLEVRPIVGRAEHAAWWQIELEDGTAGWVADEVVTVSGYTGLVPTVTAPELPDGSTPTPGSPWLPTPRPECTPPAPTETASATPTATDTGEESEGPGSNAASGGGQGATSTATAAPSETPTATATATPEEEPEPIAPTQTAAPLPAEASTDGGGMPWLPILGLGLILAAGALFVVRRSAA